MIVIVSGLPRCGTSLMMQMLDAGGIPVLTDAIRKPDEDNPHGYYELEKVKQIKQDASWLSEADGKAFKMVSMLLYDLPSDRPYKVIFMTRAMEEILASQRRMLERQGKPQGPDDADMRQYFESHLADLTEWLSTRPNIDVLHFKFNELLADPHSHVKRMAAFLDSPLDQEKMLQAIDPSLYRNRVAESGSSDQPTIETGPALANDEDDDAPSASDLATCRHYIEAARRENGNLCLGKETFYRQHLKRGLDFAAGIILATLTAPIVLAAWTAVRLTSKGPGFFSQDRIGINGCTIRVFKLRSMYTNHHEHIDMKKVEAHQAKGLLYKCDGDPRITPVGKFIRKTSIDELPQLWNVVRGDMSLVGPRPLMPHMVAGHPELNNLRSQVRPGVTGEWQVTARHDNRSLEGMVKYDLHYVETHSFLMDLKMLLKTIPTVLNTKGTH